MAHNHWHLWNKYFSETNINIPLNLTIIEINIPNVKHQCQVQLCFLHWCHHQGWPTPLSLSFSLSLEVYGFLTLLVVAIRFKDIWAMAFWRIRFNASQNYRLFFELSLFFFAKSLVFVVHSFKWILFTLNKAALELLKLAKNRDVEWSANPPLLGGDSQFGSLVTNWGWGFHSWTWHWGFNFDVGGIDFCLDNGFLCEGYTVYLFDWNIDIYSVCANNCVSPIHKCF